ncbi:Delta and Notch-like epidermal growth factor-related receptor [Chelonia mydas]|uniref:Delta and Notch-like epidermal growth factor-related receptor n=1 Tax=Chelonia mydas TaxID=8469 RepID=M7BT22_CHEMY|nr:Delta and Notch-like epidermal growth factor-related receptor [Chelonia mydas]
MYRMSCVEYCEVKKSCRSLYTAAPFISGANLGLETWDPFIATLFLSLVDESRNDASRKDNPDQGPDKDPQITPDVACGNASSNNSAGGRLISFEVPQNTSIKIRQDATASLILLWKVTTVGFKQCSLIDGRSVTLLQALGGLVLSEEMLALGNNYFIGFVNDSVTKCIVALRLTVVVKVSTCMPVGSHSDDFQCLGKGKCITKPSEATAGPDKRAMSQELDTLPPASEGEGPSCLGAEGACN